MSRRITPRSIVAHLAFATALAALPGCGSDAGAPRQVPLTGSTGAESPAGPEPVTKPPRAIATH